MIKVKIGVEIPEYEVKYCEDFSEDIHCKFLGNYDYGLKYYCVLSGKDITKIKNDGAKIYRPYGCRCLVKNDQGGN